MLAYLGSLLSAAAAAGAAAVAQCAALSPALRAATAVRQSSNFTEESLS